MTQRMSQRTMFLVAAMVSTIALGPLAGNADANAREGCLNQWLFSGVWRVQVTAGEPYMIGGLPQGWPVADVWPTGTALAL